TWQDTATLDPSTIRATSMFTVKDWDAFVKAFQDGKQDRAANGMMARVVGHDLDDNKKVSVVTALTDTSKPFSHYKSDALKHRIAESGAVGKPTPFFFRIAKRN